NVLSRRLRKIAMRSLPTKPRRQILQRATSAQTADTPASDIRKAHGTTHFGDVFERGSAGIGRRDNGSRAHSGDAMNRYVLSLEDFQDADVSHSAGETTAQCQTDFRNDMRKG